MATMFLSLVDLGVVYGDLLDNTLHGAYLEVIPHPEVRGWAVRRKKPAMKLPSVLEEARPMAAPPKAEMATNQSVGNPLTLTTATIAARRRMRLVRTMLFVTAGNSPILRTKWTRYLVVSLSRTKAITNITTNVIIVTKLMPKI